LKTPLTGWRRSKTNLSRQELLVVVA